MVFGVFCGIVLLMQSFVLGFDGCSDAETCKSLQINDVMCSSFVGVRNLCPITCAVCGRVNGK